MRASSLCAFWFLGRASREKASQIPPSGTEKSRKNKKNGTQASVFAVIPPETTILHILCVLSFGGSRDMIEIDKKLREDPAGMTKIILDTDIGADCDDVGALMLLHSLCGKGEAEFLAATHCTSRASGLGALSAVNIACGREVPLGSYPRPGMQDDGTVDRYAAQLAAEFPTRYPVGVPQPDAAQVTSQALEEQPDASVTLCAIGPMTNLAYYLEDASLTDLIARKVRRLVAMAGCFTPGGAPEWNVASDIPAAVRVADAWPTPIVWVPFEVGEPVQTGAPLARRKDHPAPRAYALFHGGTFHQRSSWDPIAVHIAVRGNQPWWSLSAPGRVTVDPDGSTRFSPEEGGPHRYAIARGEAMKVAQDLNRLL